MSLDRPRAEDPYAKLPAVPSFNVRSTDFADGAALPLAHVASGAGGRNISPQLSWDGAPEGTASYAVTCFDPDAPTPSGFWHWAVLDIPVEVTTFAQGIEALPEPAYALGNDAGVVEYHGAAPPEGDHPHRYYFVVHAVDVPHLGVAPDASPTVLSFHLAFHTLARAILVATYAR